MKVCIEEDEMYPFYLIYSGSIKTIAGDREVPDEVVKRWREVMSEFEKVQEEMKIAYNGGSK